jgi:OmpA-OmpF porin, OOP family
MRRIIIILLSFVFVLQASSQSLANKNVQAFQPGWYVSAGAGINIYLAEGNEFWYPNTPYVFSLKENSGFVGRIGVGYEFTPVIGLRGILARLQHNWPDIRYRNADGSYKVVSFDADNLAADLMVNLSNWWAGYNPNRLIDFSAFGGLGLAYRDKDNLESTKLALIFRAGGQADLRLSHTLDFNLSVQGNFVRDDYNGYVAHMPFELYTAITAGFTYHFRGKSPKTISASTVEPKMEMKTQSVDKPAVAEQIAQPIAATPAPKPEVAVKESIVPVVDPTISPELNVNVFYPRNETRIDKLKRRDAIAKVANYMKNHPETKILVRGFADKTTGTVQLNNKLSNSRTNNVANTLIYTYAISSSRITAKSIGVKYQPFDEPNKNRVVIITLAN